MVLLTIKRTVRAPLIPFKRVAAAYRRWRDTRIFFRITVHPSGEERVYEFVLVPLRDDVYALHISRIHNGITFVLAERTITHAEFEMLRPKLQEL